MDDIFYFSSPPVSYSPSRRPPYYRNPALSGKKRKRLEAMDGFRAHACMAVLDEPTFCPSEISVLLSEYSWNFHGLPADTSLPTPDLTEDEDDDDSGGVALVGHEEIDIDEQRGLGLPSQHHSDTESGAATRTDRDYATSRTFDREVVPRLQPGESTVLGTAHPRPHTLELWAEEDSRRLRFALDGVDTDEVPRFIEPATFTAPQYHEAESTGPEPMAIDRPPVSTPAVMPTTNHSHVSARTRTGQGVAEPESLFDQDMADDPVDMDMDMEEWLPVDDPRREYDLARFLDHWRLRSVTAKDVIPHTISIQPSLQLRKPPEHLTQRDVASGDLDWQGIRWDLMGPRRRDVLAARVQMHPSRPASAARNSRSPNHVSDPLYAYRFRGFTPQHRAQTSHYQLRHVLAATSRADVFYGTGNKIMRTSLACPTVKDTVIDLSVAADLPADFRITCLTASQESSTASVLMAGGFNGEYALLKHGGVQGGAVHGGHVTHAYNGLVTHAHIMTGRRSGTPQAIFCSNDHYVRLLDIETLRTSSEFVYPSAINCSATAPDRRLRAIVGDFRDAYITNAESGEVLVTLSGHVDHGFACAWSSNGIHVATGAQDGKTLVWDARNWTEPLQTLHSVMSCPRSLHFTDEGALVVAESDDVVSIYDPLTFDRRQDLRFFGSVAGVGLLDGGKEIVVANTDKSVGGLLSFERLPGPVYSKTPGTKVLRTNGTRRDKSMYGRSNIVSEVTV